MPEKTGALCRLVVCFDGTWNTPDKGDEPTNVVRMVRAVRDRDDEGRRQVVFYDKGVGTAGGTDSLTGGGFGAGLLANVLDGYRFVANNHTNGDEIYIFGFSRGAYTARSLAGLIGLAGLLNPDDLGAPLKQVLDIYKNAELETEQKREQIAKLNFDRRTDVPIRCVGVWDTVGSLGIPGDLGQRLKRFYFHDVGLGEQINIGLHAMAIDEKRAFFAPTLWRRRQDRPERDDQTVEQVWFAGAHSNVGGSYADPDLSNIAFDWMARRVTALTDLALAPAALGQVGPQHALSTSIDSRRGPYVISRYYPYQRIINHEVPSYGGFGAWFRRTFTSIDARSIPPEGLIGVNERLHVSVLDRWGADAVPHDCPSDGSCERVPYRPINLAAAIRAHHEGRSMPVVDWNGEEVRDRDPWPESRTLP